MWLYKTEARRRCGWNRKARDDGFSLLETVVALSLAAATTAMGIELLLSEQQVRVQTGAALEALFQEDSLERGISQDVHAALHCTVDAAHQQLVLTEAGGETFTYRLNGDGQIVRVGENGGTSVMAAGVKGWQVDAADEWVAASITDRTGAERRFEWTSLAGIQ